MALETENLPPISILPGAMSDPQNVYDQFTAIIDRENALQRDMEKISAALQQAKITIGV